MLSSTPAACLGVLLGARVVNLKRYPKHLPPYDSKLFYFAGYIREDQLGKYYLLSMIMNTLRWSYNIHFL